jgi:hypothetical protein
MATKTVDPGSGQERAVQALFIADVALATRTALQRLAGELPVPAAPRLPPHLRRLLDREEAK